MALLGVAHLGAGATGATVEIIRFIELPSSVGEINAEGFAGFIAQNILLGTVNAEGFAPTVAIDTTISPSFGSLNAEGFAPMVGRSLGTYTPLLGQARAVGFAPSVNPDFRTIFPQVGIAHARTADGASLEITNFIAPPDPWFGALNLEGFSPAASGDVSIFQTGYINAEGFAPNVTSALFINAQVGEFQTHFGGTTAAIEKIKVIDGPFVGEKNYVGFQPSADVFREGGIWFAQSAPGQGNAEGFAPTLAIERTVFGLEITADDINSDPSVYPYGIALEGFAATVSRPNVAAFSPLIGVVNAEGISGIVTTGRWTPTGPGSQIWTPVDEESQTWTSVSEESSTWTPVDEAV